MIKTAVIGASGFVGGHLWNAYRQEHPDSIGTAYSNKGPGLTVFDLRNPNIDSLGLVDSGHKAVLISSAKPNVGYCENEPEASHAVNVKGMLETMRQIAKTPLKIIFLSSDYAFEGKTGRYDDEAETLPTTEYGRQKVAVEQELPNITDNYLIIRLSKIYGTEKGDATLLDELAQSFVDGKKMRVASDQYFCPTHVEDLTRAIDAAQQKDMRGKINIASPERLSRYEIVSKVGQAMQADMNLVEEISLYDIPSMAGRPLDTSMSCNRLQGETDAAFRPLDEAILVVADNYR
jgi:dTDP-4-dehydrorhamnose reductase